jgi:hypothetical protein
VAAEPPEVLVREPGRSVGQEDQVGAPAFQFQGQAQPALAGSIDRDRLVTDLPAVAVGTVKDPFRGFPESKRGPPVGSAPGSTPRSGPPAPRPR